MIELCVWLVVAVVLATILTELTLNGDLVSDYKVPSTMIAILSILILLTVVVAIGGAKWLF